MLWRCLLAEAPVSLTLKPWQAINAADEYRLFFRSKALVGVTPLHRAVAFADASARIATLARRIAGFGARIGAVLHVPGVVADILLLLELNPWHPFTDSGLFDWQAPAGFDGTLRLREPSGAVVGCPLPSRRRDDPGRYTTECLPR